MTKKVKRSKLDKVKPSKPEEVKRSKLIVPHGPGGILDLPGNLSVIVGGPRQWEEAGLYPQFDMVNRITDDPRFASFLGVDHFRMPPTAPSKPENGPTPSVPVFRFPLWHYCKECYRMEELERNAPAERRCRNGDCGGDLVPFRWVAICDQGHLQDVPLHWWVHRNAPNRNCHEALSYHSGGGGDNLASVKITCECEAEETLQGITGQNFYCKGLRPWLGRAGEGEVCAGTQPNLKVVLKGQSNVYFPQVQSGLFIPVEVEEHEAILQAFWDEKQDSIRERAERSVEYALDPWLEGNWDNNMAMRQSGISADALNRFVHGKLDGAAVGPENMDDSPGSRERFRYREFQVFRAAEAKHADLAMRTLDDYNWAAYELPEGLVDKVVLLDKLRETRVLTGFKRLDPDAAKKPDQMRSLMWGPHVGNWLPAFIVRGEGIFIQFNDALLEAWERDERVAARFQRFKDLPAERLQLMPLSARFLFLHTLAHLLIRRLTYECGYGSSALRERIYCHNVNPDEPMNAIIIYTASGDSEGSLGGLVRQGEPGRLQEIMREALEDGEWCSSDPVCSDIGNSGQGPNSVNGAACHNCALVPETSCESFNKYLDRKFVIDLEEGEGKIPSLFHMSS